MRVTQGGRAGEAALIDRVLRSGVAGAGLVAMATAFVLDAQGFSRSVSATMLFSGVVLFSTGVSMALGPSRRNGAQTSVRDEHQALWSGRLGVMPLAGLLVSVFVAKDVWAMVSGAGAYSTVFVLVAVALTLGSFGELVMFRLRPLLDDELTRAYAHSAMGWGYVAGFVGAGVVAASAVLDLRIAVMAMLPMMALSVWVAGLRLFWLMRDADEG